MKKMVLLQKAWSNKSILIIFFLGLFLRVYQLSVIPHGFHVDEAISGYIGRFILLNGKDVYGNNFPLFYFDSFGDYRTILPMYINGLSTFVFGVNVFAVRFPSAFIGALAVFPIFGISKMLFKEDKFAFIPSLVFAILPWNIVLSRATEEAVVGLTMAAFGVFFLLKCILEKKASFFFWGSLCLFSTYFIYPSFRLLVPLIFFPLPFFIPYKRHWFTLGLIFFLLLTFIIALTPYGQGRYQQTSVFGSKELANRINAENIAMDYDEGNNNNGILTARIFHNKITGYTQELAQQYFSYFSPDFLFLQGGLPDRYVVPKVGLLYITFGLLLFALVMPITAKINNALFSYLLYLLITSPIPAALTLEDAPNVNRDIFMSLIIVFLIGVGFYKAFHLCKNKWYKIIFCTLLVLTISLEFIYFEHQYFAISPSYQSFQRDDGNQQLITYLQKKNYIKDIIVPIHDMPMYYLFFNNLFDKSIVGKFQKNLSVKQINNMIFIDDLCPTNQLTSEERNQKSELIVEDGNCFVNNNYILLATIVRRDSTVAFRIFTPK